MMAVATLILRNEKMKPLGDRLVPILISIQWLLTLLLVTSCGLVAALFLPALHELKTPKDPSPRRIPDTTIRGMQFGKEDLTEPRSVLSRSSWLTLIDLEDKEIFGLTTDARWIDVKTSLPIDIET